MQINYNEFKNKIEIKLTNLLIGSFDSKKTSMNEFPKSNFHSPILSTSTRSQITNTSGPLFVCTQIEKRKKTCTFSF